MDVRNRERSGSLESVSEIVESRLIERALELCWIGEEVENTRSEIASQTRATFGLTNVDLEVRACEWTVLDATTTRAAESRKAEYVLPRSKFNKLAIATEAGCRGEDLCLVRSCGVAIFGYCVKRPVPVAIRC
jgi:hypothetical protein